MGNSEEYGSSFPLPLYGEDKKACEEMYGAGGRHFTFAQQFDKMKQHTLIAGLLRLEEIEMMKNNQARNDLLYETILTLKTVEECRAFFQDLCTVAELRAMEQRLDVAVLLDGGMIYNDILERTGASSATISRVNRALQYGADGYKTVLSRMKK